MGTVLISDCDCCVDSECRIIAVNDYALRSIEAEQNAVLDGVHSTYLTALVPAIQLRSATAIEAFGEAMEVLSSSIQRLIMDAQVNLSNLDKLEARLGTLHELVAREDNSLSSARCDLLSELWTKLGGNKRILGGYDYHLSLLKNLSTYRAHALVHVVAALTALQSLSDDMEDLRERVTAPEILGRQIPAEVHMKSIKRGLDRLAEGRLNANEREKEAIRMILTYEG